MILLKVYTGEGSETHRISDFPCSIGRALSNEIVLNHASVSSKHAVLDRDAEGYYIADAGSTNGLRQGKTKLNKIKIDKTIKVNLGDIKIELRSSDEATENTAIIHFSETPLAAQHSFNSFAMALGVVGLSIVLDFLSSYFLEPSFRMSAFAGVQIGAVLSVLAAGAVLSIWSKLQRGQYQFLALFTICMLCLLLLKLTIAFSEFFDFNFNNASVYQTWDLLLVGLILFYGFNEIGKVIFNDAAKIKRQAIAAMLMVSVLSIPTITRKIAEDRFDTVSLPLITSYSIRSFPSATHNFENFEKSVATINEKLKQSREEQIKKNAKLN